MRITVPKQLFALKRKCSCSIERPKLALVSSVTEKREKEYSKHGPQSRVLHAISSVFKYNTAHWLCTEIQFQHKNKLGMYVEIDSSHHINHASNTICFTIPVAHVKLFFLGSVFCLVYYIRSPYNTVDYKSGDKIRCFAFGVTSVRVCVISVPGFYKQSSVSVRKVLRSANTSSFY